jgi:hypothetical protein
VLVTGEAVMRDRVAITMMALNIFGTLFVTYVTFQESGAGSAAWRWAGLYAANVLSPTIATVWLYSILKEQPLSRKAKSLLYAPLACSIAGFLIALRIIHDVAR